ncbi:glycoside hydrolase family 15 protein [soil metagenome]
MRLSERASEPMRLSDLPIADYALLSDRHTAALVSRAGSIDWLCLPRFDAGSVFGRLLGADAGHWSVGAVGATDVTRRDLERTMVLETTFTTPTGRLVLEDALVMGEGNRGHDLGKDVPHLLARRATCPEGEVEVTVEYAPRPEYGLVHPLVSASGGGLTAVGGPDVLVLSSPFELAVDGSTATGRAGLREGEHVSFALHHCLRGHGQARVWGADEIDVRLDDTASAWRSWSEMHQAYEGPWRDLVHQSGRVLQGLSYQPTGAICAAATTSLPETAGGNRNWDYRYSWVRDASFTIEALWVAACPDEADEFFEYMTTSAAASVGRGGDLQLMFGIGGEHDLTERELPHLPGWRGSRPVRVGNGAWNQRQLDVYGELLNSYYRLSDQVTEPSGSTRRFFVELADAAAERWHDQDQGIWEVRGEPRDFVYSKLMCWVALDRAVTLADRLGADEATAERWGSVRDDIHEAIVTKGWSDTAGAFAQTFGSDELDASNLMMPMVGFLPADDPRMLATIDATAQRLTDDRGLVYRYRAEDGLEGEEGTFLLCTFWLAQAMALSGQPARARAVFERAIAFVNDVGLLAEEVDAGTGELLGNFPQAFSHIGLVNAAWAISEAERATP